MRIEQLYTGCLAQGAYYLESDGDVAIIDPLREVDTYLKMAKSQNAKIKYIFETHFHADFVSGHVTLSQKTGAPIVYGPNANPEFECTVAADNQEFKLGKVKIRVLHTPGHTMESSSFLLLDENGSEHAIFTGDTLFLGDVGRPDLAQKASEITVEQLAKTLYDSLRTKIMTLPDNTIVYPGHGAGSACGKKMSKETTGTVGNQKQNNYALRADMTKAEFVQEVTDGLLAPPAYFPLNVMLNKRGYEDIDVVLQRGKVGMSPSGFEEAANNTGAIILDVRHQDEFTKTHIPKSIFIGVEGGFAPWVGAMLEDVNQPILLVCGNDKLKEVITRLARVGFDQVLGYLEGGVEAWKKSDRDVDSIESISAQDFSKLAVDLSLTVYDVRKESEFQSQHVIGAINTSLVDINNYLDNFQNTTNNYIHCAGGYRSVIAESILKSRGIHNFVNVLGGFDSIKKTNTKVSNYVCPSEL
ncbi:MAG: hydroxyacylglutathione hydrolase [Glaciecola sp.]|jgi:hydroxyacylglutathione hydrolase